MPLFAVSDAVWLAVLGILALVVKEYFEQKRSRLAAEKVEEVRADLRTTSTRDGRQLDGLAKVAKATHTLVNSSYSVQLRLTAVALRRVAELTRDPGDAEAAAAAEKALADHDAKQGAVDDQPGTDAEKAGRPEGRSPDPGGRTVGEVVGETAERVEDIHEAVVKPQGTMKDER